MKKEVFLAVLRHLLNAIGVAVAAHGYTTDATWQTLSGATLTLAAAAWSILEKNQNPRP